MNEKLNFYLSDVLMEEIGASETSIKELQDQVGFELPKQYIDLMRKFNGGEGEVGENSWLYLYPLENLILINKANHLLMEQIPDYFLFGKDAADTGYAFHKMHQTFHSFGLMSNFKTDSIEFCGSSFIEFLEYLYNQ